MATLNEVLERLNALLAEVERLDTPVRDTVLELLDGLDALHRTALERLPEALGSEGVQRLRAADPGLAWLLDAYGVDGDPLTAADRALDEVRPYIHSHGGEVQLLGVADGVVRVRLAGACSGCSASAVTLKEGVESALRAGLPAFRGLEVEPDIAPAHPPPGATLLQIENLIARPATVEKHHGT
ncbi:MAG: NifU family protein [Actinomycetota bacterium]|nr:NifU family protein [Actinomycetota bacterium]